MNYFTKCKFFLFCIAAVAGLFFQGCKDDEESSVTFSISNKKLTFIQNASNKDVSIYSSNKWSSKSSEEWISVSPAKADGNATITVSAKENTGETARFGFIAFENNTGRRDTINVLQTGTKPMIAISQTTASVGQSGGIVNVLVASSAEVGSWEISSDVRWIKLPTISSSTNNCTFTIVPNAYKQRTGKVLFKQVNGSIYAELTISQSEATENIERGIDSTALVRFYEALLGDEWERKWDLATPITSWPGVTVVGGRVVAISLNNNKLKGEIPADIVKLSELQTISLEGNQLTGNIPSELASLKKLEALNLSKNLFSGSMPKVIQQITTLKKLNASNNNYTDFIDFSTLTNLEELILSNNKSLAVDIPKTIGKLTKITKLDLCHNALTGAIPSELMQLTNLTDLKLSFNQLSGAIPSNLGNLSKLTNLELQGNNLSGAIPASIGDIKELKNLLLNDNELTGAIPASTGNLVKLETLLLNNNNLTGAIPGELGNLQVLKSLYLNDNELSGTIPEELAGIRTLKTLNLTNNRLSKPLPEAIRERANEEPFFDICKQKDGIDICQ